MTSNPLISVIVPVFNDARRLEQCLASIRANGFDGTYEMIVADNGSVDDSVQVAVAAGAEVIVLPGCRVSQLRNAAAQRARGTILAFVDADHLLDAGWLAAGAEVFLRREVGAAGAHYLAPADTNSVQRAYDRLRRREPAGQDVDWLPSGNLLVRREVFDVVHGFDTGLETCEDVDFCNRVRAAGFRVVNALNLRSIHLGDPPTLGAVFRGELWRGRDNLRVTFRRPLRWRSVCSFAVSLAALSSLFLASAGLVLIPVFGALPLIAGVAGLAALVLLRTGRMAANGGYAAADLVPTLAVAGAYDLGRAVALVTQASHRVRQHTRDDAAV